MTALPSVTFENFVKKPTVAFLIIALGALSYLYIDNKSAYKTIIEQQKSDKENLEKKIEKLEFRVHQSDSMLFVISQKIRQVNEKVY